MNRKTKESTGKMRTFITIRKAKKSVESSKQAWEHRDDSDPVIFTTLKLLLSPS